jgi:tetratricopeptide (TPR) repeat protein
MPETHCSLLLPFKCAAYAALVGGAMKRRLREAKEGISGDAAAEVERALAAAARLGLAGQHAMAEELLRPLLAHHPARIDVRLALAQLLVDGAEESAALAELDRAIALDPANQELHLLAAAAYERLGEPQAAADHLAVILAGEADHPLANRRLAELLECKGDRPGAIRCWRRVVARAGGGDLEAMTALGIQLSHEGQHQEALKVLYDVAALGPRLGWAQANLGMGLLAAGHVEEALRAFGRALELERASAQAHCGLGLAYQRLGRSAEAAEAFRATEALAPDSAAGPLNLALSLDALGEREEARAALLRAAAVAPEDTEIRLALERFLARPPAAEEDEPAARPAPLDPSITGDLKSFPLCNVLECLRVQGKSGALVVSSRQGAGLVRLVRGAVTSASAPGIRRLGEALVKRGLLDRPRLAAALARQRVSPAQSREALGSLLLDHKLIDRVQLGKVVFQQAVEALEQMTAWSEGAFSFHHGDAGEPPPMSFCTQQLILELRRKRDAREATTISESLR